MAIHFVTFYNTATNWLHSRHQVDAPNAKAAEKKARQALNETTGYEAHDASFRASVTDENGQPADAKAADLEPSDAAAPDPSIPVQGA